MPCLAELLSNQFGKGIGPVADPVILFRIDLRNSLVTADLREDGIIAKSTVTARRPCVAAINATFVNRAFPVRPGNGENAGKPA